MLAEAPPGVSGSMNLPFASALGFHVVAGQRGYPDRTGPAQPRKGSGRHTRRETASLSDGSWRLTTDSGAELVASRTYRDAVLARLGR